MENNYRLIIVALVALLNLVVSIYLAKRSDLESFQKVAQIILVWLIPVFAATGLWLFHRSQDIPISSSRPFGGGSSDSSNISGGGD
ncbi:hypothetical protein A7985_07500 [Pseudoalteromonas luteoviolacea]|uniref:Uncharacterized protein n=1 Tax=Pseudoalteromonas luteoviolacea TaxID=43657 RepID=A0A1C0TWS0_9GAMM|nr:hypothetical protein [Pseudoalteromonas luteoviolacea]OCQ23776.1 hypothetical protein A7985_07500 [Pseudoalteromonas luteoviolacea]